MKRIIAVVAVIGLLVIGLSGCQAVAPWERGDLARPEMQIDPDPLTSSLNDQVYDSKEASSGSGQAAGAGCGCN